MKFFLFLLPFLFNLNYSSGQVGFVISDILTDKPIDSAKVLMIRNGKERWSGITNNDGLVQTSNPKDGSYELIISKDGYESIVISSYPWRTLKSNDEYYWGFSMRRLKLTPEENEMINLKLEKSRKETDEFIKKQEVLHYQKEKTLVSGNVSYGSQILGTWILTQQPLKKIDSTGFIEFHADSSFSAIKENEIKGTWWPVGNESWVIMDEDTNFSSITKQTKSRMTLCNRNEEGLKGCFTLIKTLVPSSRARKGEDE